MANRENQGVQIALIIFLVMIFAMSIIAYMGFDKAKKANNATIAAHDNYLRESNGIKKTLADYNRLKELVGHDFETKLGNVDLSFEEREIESAFEIDMTMYGPDWEEERNYRKLPGYLLSQIKAHSEQVVNSSVQVKALIAEKTQIRNRENALKAAAVSKQRESAQHLLAARAAFNQSRSQSTQQSGQLARQLVATRKKTTIDQEKALKEKLALKNQLAKLEAMNKAKDERLKAMTDQSIDAAQGQVTWVNQRSKTLYINLGSLDGLRPRINFRVFDQKESNLAGGDMKANIEVTRVLNGKLAECKIVKDSAIDPIMPRDQIYSPSWQPGRFLRFALAGEFDIDEDQKDDRSRVRNIISSNGGLIDAEVDINGRVVGKLGLDTRYMVVGNPPRDKNKPEAIEGYESIVSEARQLGIERISIDRLLSMMNWKGSASPTVVTSGAGAKRGIDAANPTTPKAGAPAAFRERRPPTRRARGAY